MEPGYIIFALVILAIAFGIFLVCREIVTWYFKFTELSTKMDTVNKNLAAIHAALEQQTARMPAPQPIVQRPASLVSTDNKSHTPMRPPAK